MAVAPLTARPAMGEAAPADPAATRPGDPVPAFSRPRRTIRRAVAVAALARGGLGMIPGRDGLTRRDVWRPRSGRVGAGA